MNSLVYIISAKKKKKNLIAKEIRYVVFRVGWAGGGEI